MGATGSKLEKALGDQFPEGERYFGLENFGNTCYCNSVLQVHSSHFLIDRLIDFMLIYLGFLEISDGKVMSFVRMNGSCEVLDVVRMRYVVWVC